MKYWILINSQKKSNYYLYYLKIKKNIKKSTEENNINLSFEISL